MSLAGHRHKINSQKSLECLNRKTPKSKKHDAIHTKKPSNVNSTKHLLSLQAENFLQHADERNRSLKKEAYYVHGT